jgi:hypothetical protein
VDGADEDFELHELLGPLAPSAVAALVELAGAGDVSEELRGEALERLQQMRDAGLLDDVPLAQRTEVERLLRTMDRPQ